jgi:hypothetical protein
VLSWSGIQTSRQIERGGERQKGKANRSWRARPQLARLPWHCVEQGSGVVVPQLVKQVGVTVSRTNSHHMPAIHPLALNCAATGA